MRGGRRARGLASLAIALAGTTLSAHRQDEYLQAARLSVEPRRVELHLDLTPGIAIADGIVHGIDRNRDGVLSRDEQQAYVTSVLESIELRADERTVRMEPIASSFPDSHAFRRGEGTIRLRVAAVLPRLPDGEHHVAFHNRHRPDVSVYLANALLPDGDSITITAQRRDPAQRDLTITYDVRHQRSIWLPAGLMLAVVSVLNYCVRGTPRRRGSAG